MGTKKPVTQVAGFFVFERIPKRRLQDPNRFAEDEIGVQLLRRGTCAADQFFNLSPLAEAQSLTRLAN